MIVKVFLRLNDIQHLFGHNKRLLITLCQMFKNCSLYTTNDLEDKTN